MMKRFMLVVMFMWIALPGMAGHPGEMAGMVHPSKPIPQGFPQPRLSLEITEDSMSGYNLELTVDNYVFEIPNGMAQSGVLAGHAHLFINGKKIQRMYGVKFHLPSSYFVEGVNQITVSLNDHDHGSWLLEDGKEANATLLIDTRREDFVVSHYSSMSQASAAQ